MDNNDKLAGEEDTGAIDSASNYNRERTKFQKGNDKGVRFAPNEPEEDEDQLQIENEDDIL
jgi:hypothetical protein